MGRTESSNCCPMQASAASKRSMRLTWSRSLKRRATFSLTRSLRANSTFVTPASIMAVNKANLAESNTFKATVERPRAAEGRGGGLPNSAYPPSAATRQSRSHRFKIFAVDRTASARQECPETTPREYRHLFQLRTDKRSAFQKSFGSIFRSISILWRRPGPIGLFPDLTVVRSSPR